MEAARPSSWEADCLRGHGRVLIGRYRHWCSDWDDLPVDETCREFACCTCYMAAANPFGTIRRALLLTLLYVDDLHAFGWSQVDEANFERAFQHETGMLPVHFMQLAGHVSARPEAPIMNDQQTHHRSCELRNGGTSCTC